MSTPRASWQIHDPGFESDESNPELAVSPWAGHRGFAYDWLAFTQPRRVVELGTHYGCSFFAFAQALKDLGVDSELVGVDTWTGDEHAGYYDESVFELVTATIARSFDQLRIRLVRSSFAEALDDVEDGSVDLLHIDGYHTYEAVHADYESWLGKVAPQGVVFFHDVAPSSGYGSARYWAKLSARTPHLEFLEHSFGLGVLFPKDPFWYERSQEVGLLPWLPYYRYRSEARLAKTQVADQARMLEERWELLERTEALVRERDQAIADQARMLEERWELLERTEALVRERDQTIAGQAQTIAGQAQTIAGQAQTIADQARMLEERWALLKRIRAMVWPRVSPPAPK